MYVPYYDAACQTSYLGALNRLNGSKKWEKLVAPSSVDDNPFRGYATQDGKAYFFSRDNNVAHRLRMIAYQDAGSDATELFSENYREDGQIIGFGPGGTMYLTEGTTIHAVSGGDLAGLYKLSGRICGASAKNGRGIGARCV